MERFITKKLINWKNNNYKKPLLLRGARQVGKTWSVIDFGEKYFQQGKLHIVDLEKHPEWHSIFEKNLDTKRIKMELEIQLKSEIEAGKDLLFIDEIQSCPRAIMALRYFYEDMPDLHIVAAGSLIEFALDKISFPVGRIQTLTMYPMNFYEFLQAGNNEILADRILSTPKDLSRVVNDLAIDELKKYFFIGGMPEAVSIFFQSGKIRKAFEVQKDLISTFRNDFSKYAKMHDNICLDSVLTSVAKNIGNQIKYVSLADGFSIHTIKKSFNLLCRANLVNKVSSVKHIGIPLAASASLKKIKSVFLDIGLMQHLCGIPVDIEFQKKDLLSIHNGSLAEQFVGQEILSTGYEELFYWSRNVKSSTAEIDYLVTKNGNIFPLEVKSGVAGKLKSLHIFLDSYKNITHAYVLSTREYSELPEQKLIFIPLYLIFGLLNN